MAAAASQRSRSREALALMNNNNLPPVAAINEWLQRDRERRLRRNGRRHIHLEIRPPHSGEQPEQPSSSTNNDYNRGVIVVDLLG